MFWAIICMCVYVSVCSWPWNVFFCNLLEVKIHSKLLLWYEILWYYMKVVVLWYGSCGIYSIQFVWNIICPKQFVWNIIFSNQIIWKFYYCYYRLCPSRFFQYRVYESCYCEMVVMVCVGNCMEHYLSKLDYMEIYLLLLQIVSK